MIDPAAIGTAIIWLEAEKWREIEVERRGLAEPIKSRRTERGLSRSLARRLRSAADRLEPAAASEVAPRL